MICNVRFNRINKTIENSKYLYKLLGTEKASESDTKDSRKESRKPQQNIL